MTRLSTGAGRRIRGRVFVPDPITSSGNTSLSPTIPDALEAELRDVWLDNLEEPSGGKFRLSGRWVETKDVETPPVPAPVTEGDFCYAVSDPRLLNVMTYYWLDRLITYLRGLGIQAFNHAVEAQRIAVDAQGLDREDNSHFLTDPMGRPYIALGGGPIPDATDAHVIVHEYGHAVHYLLMNRQNCDGSEEGFGDFLAGAWLDRFNTLQFQRESVFPWANKDRRMSHRFFDMTRRFDDSDFASLDPDVKGSVFAATLWDIFLAMGGSDHNACKRVEASDTLIQLYLEMLTSLTPDASYPEIANALVVTDVALSKRHDRRVHDVIIRSAFGARGLQLAPAKLHARSVGDP